MPSLIGNKPNQVPSNGDLGTLAFQDASNPKLGAVVADGLTVDTTTLVVDTVNDRVGIGTASPSQKLTVAGNIDAVNGRFIVNTAASAAGVSDISFGALSGGTWINTPSGTAGYIAVAGGGVYQWTSSSHAWTTSSTERMRITSAGVVELAQGQIKFPATQVASADANTLDDYEEGTWTPNQGGGLTVGGAFSSIGRYTKVGNLVTVWGQVTGATSIAVSAVGAICTNLPFSMDTAIGCTGIATGIWSSSNSATFISLGAPTNLISAQAISGIANITFTNTYRV